MSRFADFAQRATTFFLSTAHRQYYNQNRTELCGAMRVSFSGRTLASQANNVGSIPITRSSNCKSLNFKDFQA